MERIREQEQGADARRAVLDDAVERLEAAGVEHPRRNAEWLLADVLGCSRAELYAYPARPVDPDHRRQFAEKVARRARHEPLQYILGYEEFYGLRLRITPDVLIPRPETEEVVEEALRCMSDVDAPRVLDVGTGSGCIALALQHERPDATVYACDVSREALSVARSNAEAHELGVQFFQADVLEERLADHITLPLDLVISNPPYIPDSEASSLSTDVREHEPRIALFSGDDPLRFYRALARQTQDVLADGRWFIVETHAHYAGKVGQLLRQRAYAEVHIKEDLSGRARMVVGRYQASG